MESTGIYQIPIKRFFLENNYKIYIINPLYSKMYKNNLRKAKQIKDEANKSYPSVSKDDSKVNSLLITVKLLKEYMHIMEELKINMINLAKKSYMFNSINQITGIGELTTALIIAELGDISRFNNIKQLTAYCGLDPSIKQSGKSINIKGPISKSGNKYIRRIL